MIQRITSEEEEWWNKEMENYLKEQTASPLQAAFIIAAFLGAFIIAAFWYRQSHLPAAAPVEQQLRDTIELAPGHQNIDGTVPILLKRKEHGLRSPG